MKDLVIFFLALTSAKFSTGEKSMKLKEWAGEVELISPDTSDSTILWMLEMKIYFRKYKFTLLYVTTSREFSFENKLREPQQNLFRIYPCFIWYLELEK